MSTLINLLRAELYDNGSDGNARERRAADIDAALTADATGVSPEQLIAEADLLCELRRDTDGARRYHLAGEVGIKRLRSLLYGLLDAGFFYRAKEAAKAAGDFPLASLPKSVEACAFGHFHHFAYNLRYAAHHYRNLPIPPELVYAGVEWQPRLQWATEAYALLGRPLPERPLRELRDAYAADGWTYEVAIVEQALGQRLTTEQEVLIATEEAARQRHFEREFSPELAASEDDTFGEPSDNYEMFPPFDDGGDEPGSGTEN